MTAASKNGHKPSPDTTTAVAEKEQQKRTERPEKPPKPTDDELGDQLLDKWNSKYVFMYGAWHYYEEGLWKIDRRMSMQFWQVLIDNKKLGIRPNANRAASIDKYCQLKAMIDDEQLEANRNYINLKNGLYNLERDWLESHSPELYMTSQLDFAFDPKANCPLFIKFLETVLVLPDGSPDYELIALVQEAFYYSLTADTGYRVSFWCVGLSGSGKSTLINILITLAGDSHAAIDLDTLKDNQYQIADIAGKRLVTFSEPDSRQPLADGWYKKLVSKDTISARQIHGKPFNFVPICKLWGSMNDTPRVIDRSDAVFSRVIIIPMNHVIPNEQRDLSLEDRLKAELPGIFNWALEGGRRLRRNGRFTRSQQSEQARDDYRLENDNERVYLSERCTLAPDLRTNNDALYQDYRAWCLENGYNPKQKERVGKEWKRLGLIPGKSNGVRQWKGVGLNNALNLRK